jgi:uncharacterized membrane protein (DUF485 family)
LEILPKLFIAKKPGEVMNKLEVERFLNNPSFVLLTKTRKKIKMAMVILTMLVFLTIQILWAFYPEIVNVRVPTNGATSLAIWLTVLMVVAAIFLSGYYALVAGKKLDALNKQLLSVLKHEK